MSVTASSDAPITIAVVGDSTLADGLVALCRGLGCDVLALATVPASAGENPLADRQVVFDLTPAESAVHLGSARARIASLESLLSDPDATLLVQASAVPLSDLVADAARPERILGVRLLTPVGVLPLMELVSAPVTSAKCAFKAGAFLTAVLGKHLIRSEETPLFVEDAMPIPYVVAAIRLAESRLADRDDVDAAHIPGCTREIGPLEFADLIGLDVLHEVLERLQVHDPSGDLHPPESLVRHLDRGELGRRTGRGFFRYPREGHDFTVLPSELAASRTHP